MWASEFTFNEVLVDVLHVALAVGESVVVGLSFLSEDVWNLGDGNSPADKESTTEDEVEDLGSSEVDDDTDNGDDDGDEGDPPDQVNNSLAWEVDHVTEGEVIIGNVAEVENQRAEGAEEQVGDGEDSSEG